MNKRFFLLITLVLLTFKAAYTQSFQIKSIQDQVVPYPHSLLLSFQIKADLPISKVTFTYESDIDDAIIKGQSIYWKPDRNDVGRHRITIIATAPNGQTAKTSFMVEVRPFNTPPRFIPLRSITIPVGIPYQLPIQAFDPDGMNRNLIRYLGVSLPKSATINEQTGVFKWTPKPRQIGKNSFRVIATDQYGAASSIDVTIRVIQVPPRNE